MTQWSCANDGIGRLSAPPAPDGGHPPEPLPALPPSKSVDCLFLTYALDFWCCEVFLYNITKGEEDGDDVGIEVHHTVV